MSVGVIGGSDGPTAIFVTGDPAWTGLALLGVVVLVAAGVALWLWHKRKGKK